MIELVGLFVLFIVLVWALTGALSWWFGSWGRDEGSGQ